LIRADLELLVSFQVSLGKSHQKYRIYFHYIIYDICNRYGINELTFIYWKPQKRLDTLPCPPLHSRNSFGRLGEDTVVPMEVPGSVFDLPLALDKLKDMPRTLRHFLL
jgi:hypothetical protein